MNANFNNSLNASLEAGMHINMHDYYSPELTKNGCSTTVKNQEKFEYFNHPHKKGVKLVQYDYVHESGKLFSCVKESVKKCRVALAVWMVQNNL